MPRKAVYCISLARCSVQSGPVLVLVAEQEGKWLVQDKECTSSGQTSLLLVTRHPAVHIMSTVHTVHTVHIMSAPTADQRLWRRRHCNTLTDADPISATDPHTEVIIYIIYIDFNSFGNKHGTIQAFTTHLMLDSAGPMAHSRHIGRYNRGCKTGPFYWGYMTINK